MSAHLGKIALMVMMSHGFRSLSQVTGPRWAGLALGLPCTTAVALVGEGRDRGVDYAVLMSGASLIGLAGAVALPMAFAQAVVRGWRLDRAILLGIASYLSVALLAGWVLPGVGDASVGVALIAVGVAGFVASRIRVGDRVERSGQQVATTISRRLLRTVVPILCLMACLLMGEAFGPKIAGLMSTFPGVTLTVLCMTHLESGPASALRMAKALPSGNLAMVGFLTAFRFACPTVGLSWGTAAGYAGALASLALIIGSGQVKGWAGERLGSFRVRVRPASPKAGRRFAPLQEALAS